MQQIDFYILTSDNPLPFTCRLLEKAYKQNHQVDVCMSSPTDAQKLNDLLWSFSDISFVPHHLISDNENQSSPIVISHNSNLTAHKDIYVTLTNEIPATMDKFQRIIFVVPNDETQKQLARQHYKTFSNKKLNVSIHKI